MLCWRLHVGGVKGSSSETSVFRKLPFYGQETGGGVCTLLYHHFIPSFIHRENDQVSLEKIRGLWLYSPNMTLNSEPCGCGCVCSAAVLGLYCSCF